MIQETAALVWAANLAGIELHVPPWRVGRQRQVVTRMAKAQRPGRVFIDWSQNSGPKTTVAPYSLRAKQRPTSAG